MSLIADELEAAKRAEAAVLRLRSGMGGTVQVLESLRAANLIALQNSVHFPSAGPMNDARKDVCSALQDLIVSLMESKPPAAPLDRTIVCIQTWKQNLTASHQAHS